MNTYRYTFIAACPGNGEQIVYTLELRHTQKVLVEHIKTACALHKQGHQEEIAADLHTRFGGHLTLRAVHHGVDIETVLAAPAQAQEDARYALTLEELDQLDRAIEHLVEGEDTDVDWRLLTRAASLGYLECERFTVPPTARDAIDAARAAQGGEA